MSIGLPSGTAVGGQSLQRLGVKSRAFKVTTSIAEQAIFIPKPRKRVSFEMKTDVQLMGSGGGKAGNLPGSGKSEYTPLPGSDVAGRNIKQGSLGANGLTARFNTSAYGGGAASGGAVKMTVNNLAAKQQNVIATQEEGRQVNRGQTHFTQQYDSYGRPRIGFSREPYDFAATKYVSVTSQVSFQANMANIHAKYNEYLINGSEKLKKSGDKPAEIPVFGATSQGEEKKAVEGSSAKDVKLMGETSAQKGDVTSQSAEELFKQQQVKVLDVFKTGGTEPKIDGGPPSASSGKKVDLAV